MKICFFHPALVVGGAERVMCMLTQSWIDAGHEVSILYVEKPTQEMKCFDFSYGNRIKLLCLHHLPKGRLRYRLALRKAFTKENPDIIVSFMNGTNILACSILPWFKKWKIIISERGNPLFANYSFKDRIKHYLYYHLADAMVFQTQTAAKFCQKYFYVPKYKSIVINNPARKVEYKESTHLFRKKTILGMGRLHNQKNFELLINAFSKIAEEYPDWDLYIGGEGEERTKLELLREKLNLNDRVFLLGVISNVFDYYKQADIFVLSSDWEGLPNSLIEAMSTGTACISCNCNFGPADLIKNEENGLLVPINSVDLLADSIKQLIDNEILRKKIAKNAELILETLSKEKIILKWLTLLEKLKNEK